jgi:2-phosphoglycolate phosphatase
MVFSDVAAVFFDLDGTLIDSAPDMAAATDQMRLNRGLHSLPLSLYRPRAGSGARGMLDVAFQIGADDPQYEDLKSEFFANYAVCLLQRTTVFAGVPALVSQLHQNGLPWGIVTNKATQFADPLVRFMPSLGSASVMVCGDTTPHTKPHPEPLFEAARRLKVEASRCIYVGDDHRDIVAGHAAGMKTVAATYGYLGVEAPVSEWGAHAEINSPLALLQLLGST